MAVERPEHGFVLISQAEADAVGRVEFQTTLRLTVDMQGEAVRGGGMVGQVAAVLFQRGVERLVVHGVSFVQAAFLALTLRKLRFLVETEFSFC